MKWTLKAAVVRVIGQFSESVISPCPQVVAVFEGLHEGRILCAAVANDNTLLTGGESTVSKLV